MNAISLNSDRLWAYLQLMRPANIVTAWADILAGFAISGFVAIQAGTLELEALGWLLLATTGLYGGGVVCNDVFDAELDAKERPERPIPSGRASRQSAATLASVLLLVGIVAAAQVSLLSAILAICIAVGAVVYDSLGKHQPLVGALNMGLCRGGNLLLGMSAVPAIVGEYWFLALIPIFYIAAITSLSQGEVHGAKGNTPTIALLLIITVITALFGLDLLPNYHILKALPAIALFTGYLLPPVIQAVRQPTPEQIRNAVRSGILSLVILDATIATGFANLPYGLFVLCLLPISIALAQIFAVT
ncbi:MAG: Protoheme IX farnesyltransferase [Chroococcidiopsis sp. SAG 2025]|uniref:UbiA-like protein EboC n=1 Tax=Chroococcidiopsis sp. SAG 2025 TaxID=171389 RepID=UPI002936F3DA|nr:UbiA-like protein EboC [Chroococcidiopsis sp. SAG 2025]MDV2991447.1 Protoheme IX farnesyltransferase [Chroococcidiopsis sp. SAG 2025]